MLSRYERITPEVAQEFISKNANLCPIDKKKVRRFARKMRWGLWDDDSDDPLIINDLGYLTDGQHRLHACVSSGKPITIRVLRCGADSTNSRSKRLKYKGVNLWECIRILWVLEKTGNRYDKNAVVLGGDYNLFGEQILEEELKSSVDVIPLDASIVKPEIAVAVHWALLGRGKQRADNFFRLLHDRKNPDLDYVRSRLEVPVPKTERYQIYCLLWGWNCWTDRPWGFDYDGDAPLPRINNPKKKVYCGGGQ